MQLGSLISGVWDNINANSANAKAKRNATTAYNREVDFYKHRFQWAKEDALEAGINPAVAAGAPGNTPNIATADTKKANAPDIATAINSAKANEIAKQNANTNEIVGTADAIKKLKEANVVDKNTATKEIEAQAKLWEAQTQAQYIDSQINRLNQMLPGELKGQAQELAVKAYQNKLNEREIKSLNKTGLTLSEWKGLGKEALDIVKFAIGGKMARPNSAQRNTEINYFNKNGEITGGKYIQYK